MQKDLPYQKHTHMLIRMGRYEQALMVALKWVAAKPDESDAWFCRSACELTLARATPALESVDKAIALEPGNPRYRAHRARSLVSAGKFMEGLKIARELVQQEQDNPQLLDALAVTLSTAGEAAEAVPVLERAIEINPAVAQYHTNYGTMLHFCGRTEEAEVAHRKALELYPEDFQAYWLVSRLRTVTAERNYIDWFKRVLDQHNDKLLARIYVNYALGKQYEDLQQFDAAYRHYAVGAEAAQEHTPYNAEETAALFERYRDEFPPELFTGSAKGCDNDEVILIVGMPRSGTTLVERIVASYDEVFAAGELHNFTHLMNERCSKRNAGKTGADMFAGAAELDFEELGRAYIDSTRPRTGHTKYFIDKYPFNFQLLGAFALALPNVKIINLTRNPMDTCFSNFKLVFMLASATYSYAPAGLAHFFAQYRSMMAHWHECLPGRILDVEYEELVQNPEDGAKRITDFLGLEWRPECLEFYKSNEAVTTASTSQIRNPINTSSLNKWKKFEAHLGPLKTALAEYGIDNV